MTSLIMADGFKQKVMDAGRELIASGKDILEMSDPSGYMISTPEAQMPENATKIATIAIDGIELSVLTLS